MAEASRYSLLAPSITPVFAVAVAVAMTVPVRGADLSPPRHVSAVVGGEQIDQALSSLDDTAARILQRSGIPGLAISVVHDGRTVYAKGFGVRKVGEAARIDPNTVFQIASLSKSLAATVVAQQVGEGHVAWDTPVVRHLPWFRLNDPWIGAHVTIGDLFSHRSGLPDHAGDDLEDLGYEGRAVLERLRYLPLASFRDSYAYTNFGLTAAAESVAAASDKDWAKLSQDVLYGPLEMTATSSRHSDFAGRADRAVLHVRTSRGFEPLHYRRPDAQSPAGGVSSSANDLARWMIMVLGGGLFEGRRIVAEEALLAAARAEMISSPSSTMDSRPGFYGFGIGVGVSSSGRVVLSHSGAFALGTSTHYSMVPGLDLGIVVLTNAAPTGAPEAIAAEFLDRVESGKPSRDWYAAYAPIMTALSEPIGQELAATWPEKPRPSARLDGYVGVYDNAYYGTAEIARDGNALTLALGPSGTLYRLTHRDAHEFSYEPRSENEADGSLASVSFTMTHGTRAQEFRIDYLDESGLGRFIRN